MDSRIDSERPRIHVVTKNVRENRTIHTIYFRDQRCATCRPGQFVMVWAPGHDEMPMSLSSYKRDGSSSVTVKPWGVGSTDLVKMKRGAAIGIRGPYGESFTVDRCRALLVGGGTGLAPLMPLARELVKVGSKVTVVIGGRSKADLLFEKTAGNIVNRKNVLVTTDDGSYGVQGFPTDIAEDLVRKNAITRVYACGPEVMMRKLYDIASKVGIKYEGSLERGMKCGIGICGSCTIGPYLLCRDGPVLRGEQLDLVQDEFGLLQRDHSGRYVAILGA